MRLPSPHGERRQAGADWFNPLARFAMKVLKFGGTSVGSAGRIRSVAGIVCNVSGRRILVLSAMSGTTNTLVELSDLLMQGKTEEATLCVDNLRRRYKGVVDELFPREEEREEARRRIVPIFDELRAQTANESFTRNDRNRILSKGEMISTHLMALTLKTYYGVTPVHLNALDFMRIGHDDRPETDYIAEHLRPLIDRYPAPDTLFLTEGYISLNAFGEVDNLRRGGSDYTATLIGEAVQAREIQIWTDIDGLHNNDPRVVNLTSPVRRLSFGEAAELARFGAKILHPACIEPAQRAQIPVKLLYTMDPCALGTVISNETSSEIIKAVSAKDDMSVLVVTPNSSVGGMPPTGETLLRIAAAVQEHKLSVDLVNVAGASFILVAESTPAVQEFCQDLSQWGQTQVQTDMTILAVVGDMSWHKTAFEAQVLQAIDDVPIRLVSYGSSNYGIDLVIETRDKERAMVALSDHLFSHLRNFGPELA